jgi:hypothetical protein
VKEILGGEGQVVSIKAEYEDLRAAVARLEQVGLKVSFGALKRLVEQAALRQENGLAGELGAVPGIQMACSFDEGEEEAATG